MSTERSPNGICDGSTLDDPFGTHPGEFVGNPHNFRVYKCNTEAIRSGEAERRLGQQATSECVTEK